MKPHLMLLSGLLCDETVWSRLLPGLEAHANTRAVDFKGYDSINAMAEKVLDIAPDRFALAGHSMGARVALEVHRLAPERIDRLALLDTGIHPAKPGEAESRHALVALAREQGMAALADKWLPPMLLPEHVQDPRMFGPMRDMVLRMTPDIFAGQVQALLNRPDAAQQLSHVQCPTLVGVGSDDAWSPPSQHELISSLIPSSTLSIFDHAGHMAPFEAAASVEKAMVEWLQI